MLGGASFSEEVQWLRVNRGNNEGTFNYVICFQIDRKALTQIGFRRNWGRWHVLPIVLRHFGGSAP
jgi:hypothetical protein